MIKFLTFIFLMFSMIISFGQSIDQSFSKEEMKKDLEIFKEIKIKANSGLYKYRTEKQIDSIYNWAQYQIEKSCTYIDFYNIICKLTDFEGSLHNNTFLPKKLKENLIKESNGYFPYPIKCIDKKWRINFDVGEIPLGAEIISINDIPISEIVKNLYKYFTTDGDNITGKQIGINTHFSKYFRLQYGLINDFKIGFKQINSDKEENVTVKSISYLQYYNNFRKRHSKPFDQIYYADLQENQKYIFKKIDSLTAVLTIYTFDLGNEKTLEHKNYITFLENIFSTLENENFKNLIVDVRQNGGGTDPNDIVTYSYLTQRNYQENKQAWISFKKIPFLKYYDTTIPIFLRPFVVRKYNREFQEIFPFQNNIGYYQDENSDDHKIRIPNMKAFKGNIYLLISPAVASAGSLFAAMVAGNENTIVMGEETMGGYFGHNGHIPIEYKLPNSKISFSFSVVNLEQDVPNKSTQKFNRGIIPDYEVSQSFADFIRNEDTLMNYVLEFIKRKKTASH